MVHGYGFSIRLAKKRCLQKGAKCLTIRRKTRPTKVRSSLPVCRFSCQTDNYLSTAPSLNHCVQRKCFQNCQQQQQQLHLEQVFFGGLCSLLSSLRLSPVRADLAAPDAPAPPPRSRSFSFSSRSVGSKVFSQCSCLMSLTICLSTFACTRTEKGAQGYRAGDRG